MALRVFTDHEGLDWNVWLVCPSMGEDSPLSARFRDGWICFQRVDGTERSRIPLDEAPANWETLSDERLDLLRRATAQAGNTGTRPTTGEEALRTQAEDAGRGGDVTGSRPTNPGDAERQAR